MADVIREVRFTPVESGDLTAQQFTLTEQSAQPLADGYVRIRATHLSLDPYVRLRLKSLTANSSIPGQVVGQVVGSRSRELREGTWVTGELTWATLADARPDQLTLFEPHPGIPVHHYVGLLGLSGITAYFGMVEVCRPTPDHQVVISGAAGGVGQVAAQIARLRGARTIGLVSSPTKAALLGKLGVDALVYRDAGWPAALQAWALAGVDTYFDNVWGAISEQVVPQVKPRGLIAICGQISGYTHARIPPLDIDWYLLLTRSLTMRGFRAVDYLSRYAEARGALADWYLAGTLRQEVEIADGLAAAPAALCRVVSGATVGKAVVALDER